MLLVARTKDTDTMSESELLELAEMMDARDERVDKSDDAHALRIASAEEIDALLIADLLEC
jgi:hypothetical protein